MVVDNTYPDIRVERQARALVRRGHRVHVICLGREGEPTHEVLDGVVVRRVHLTRRRGEGVLRQGIEYLAFLAWATALVTLLHLRHRFDVVQAHNVPDFLVFAAVPARLMGARVVLDLHDLMPEFFASRTGLPPDSLPLRIVRWQERLSAAFAHRVLTVTELWRATLVERGVDPEKTDVVMNLPDEELFAPRQPDARERPDPLTVIYHGTITHRYGIDVLVRAIDRVRRGRAVRLIIHGRGEYAPDVAALIEELGLRDHVEMTTGFLPTSELPALIGRADLGVVPNRRDIFTDGILPTKLMEYAALGVPAIVSRTTAPLGYFDDGMVRYVAPGDVTELADAIEELADDPDRRRDLATAAQRFTRTHRWADEAERYTHIIEALGADATARA